MTEATKLAWLAGLLDGEGSVGAHRCAKGGIVGNVQLAMTCGRTVGVVRDILLELGVKAVAHHHQERDPEKHRDAFYLRVSRLLDVVTLCEAIIPYAVTKRAHLELLLAFAQSRLVGRRIDAQGRVAKRSYRPYTDREVELQDHGSRVDVVVSDGGAMDGSKLLLWRRPAP